MQNYRECFEKVRKDCVKYIQSQETKKEKFKNKDQMIKSHIIPLCFWINKKRKDKKTLLVGLAGGQGTGKTTISTLLRLVLVKYFKLQVFKISIDDFYKTRKERILLSKSKHPLLLTRGVPGTHDIQLMVNLFKKVKKSTFRSINIPKFDKSIDDRCKKNNWFKLKKKPDILILEGWCVGAKPEGGRSLNRPINVLEKNADKKKIWRSYVNNQLKSKYSKLFDQLDSLLYLKAKNFKLLKRWRLKQEKKLKMKSGTKKNSKIMNEKEVETFMMTYQRITQNMFKHTPKYSSAVIDLNENHQIKKVKFKHA